MIRRTLILLWFSITICLANDWSNHYNIESIQLPTEVDPQFGGVTTLRDGRIAACFSSGEVMIYDPKSKRWSPFASGLQEPLGILEDRDGSLLVMQRPELTRLSDTDGDGLADFYQTICDDFGLSGNYHEFAYGPARDTQGNLYIALNVASNQAGIFKDIRGPFSPIGLDRETMTDWRSDSWNDNKRRAGRMYSKVPYRGCIMKITPDGESSPFAYGFRSPDGIGVDDKGRLWVTDNQGDWLGTSHLYFVEQGRFYGHPASLVWEKGWTRDPLEVPVPELESMRTPPAGQFPHGELANSPTQPIPTIAPDLFGLPKGELLIGEMNQSTLIRFLEDEVGGTTQGTMIPFLATHDLGIGNHRLTFTPDGALWVGKIHENWAGDEGLKRVTWNQRPMLIVDAVHMTKDGFDIHFNHPLGDTDPDITIQSHTYHYHSTYGSPKVDAKDIPIRHAQLSDDRQTLSIALPTLESGYIYTIQLTNTTDQDSQPLMGDILRYNVVNTFQ